MKQGIGRRIRRKEDVRYLNGRGNFVTDMMLPGQREVAFVRSPVAHARIVAITKPPEFEASVSVRDDLTDVGAMVTPNTVPGYEQSRTVALLRAERKWRHPRVPALRSVIRLSPRCGSPSADETSSGNR